MKKLFLALLIFSPSVALAKTDCVKMYDLAYNVMMVRQSNAPMHQIMIGLEGLEEEDPRLKTTDEGRWFMAEIRHMVERAYMMPNFGFMESAAHNMAAELANRQYMRCTRAKRK